MFPRVLGYERQRFGCRIISTDSERDTLKPHRHLVFRPFANSVRATKYRA